jgi:hypothetical protein
MHVPGIAFLLAAALLVAATVIAGYATRHAQAAPAGSHVAPALHGELSPVADVVTHESLTHRHPESSP